MKLTDKSVAILILSAAASPFVLCLLLYVFGLRTGTAIVAAVYAVFGLPLVLITGWVLSLTAKNSKNPLKWTVVAYVSPAIIINLAILGIVLGGQ